MGHHYHHHQQQYQNSPTLPYIGQQQSPSYVHQSSPYGSQQPPSSPYGESLPYSGQQQYQSSPYGPYGGQHQHNQQQQAQNPYETAASSSSSSSGSASRPMKIPGMDGGSSKINANSNANDAALRKEFNSLDKDKNGYLDHRDIKKLFWGLVPRSLCEQAIAYVDQNKDGKLSFEEYKAARAQIVHLVSNANNQPNKPGKKW